MRGGLERWKRGAGSQGVRQALAYAFQGSCDSHLRAPAGTDALAAYSEAANREVIRFVVESDATSVDRLDERGLRRWVDGCDPIARERRGRDLSSPDADLILDGTINAPKSYSIAALLASELATEFEALQDRLRDQIMATWLRELNARRGAGGRYREALHRIEIVELQHRRSRALDPHIHRHLWLNVKVLGRDGKWSNVDSRVAMKLHTVINAEGELAARTDPQWIAALARHGFTLDEDGEIAQLAHAVRPLSRRSNQIEANRAMLLAAWRAEHPGQEPNPEHLKQIDRRAWATARPNKPGRVDEAEWELMVRHELAAIDPGLLQRRAPVRRRSTTVDDIDVSLLAARAIVEADARSAASGGRFGLLDVRAGATRAVASSGIVAERSALQGVIGEVIERALRLTVDLLAEDSHRPAHVKGFMATATAALKVDLAHRWESLSTPGVTAPIEDVVPIAASILRDGISADDRQVAAAAAIAGTDRLVSITGPAGAGKTTMLRIARAVLDHEGRCMMVVAPTKKAATVAGREIGTAASSLHALLADHGFRWERDAAGASVWTRLHQGDIDATTQRIYTGPTRFLLQSGDRIVVDEAGMVDLQTAHALAAVAADTGAGIAMVGDHLQARPVGHSGAMASFTRRATAVVELTAVHRFHDPEYAALTLRMREPGSKDAAAGVARDLADRGLIRRVVDHDGARDAMVDAYFRWATGGRRVALVTSTNEEADLINETIQQRRVDRGDLSLARIAVGQGEQRLLVGDLVQTRRNDRRVGVENRALWTIRQISLEGIELVSSTDSGDVRMVAFEYAAESVHLAYASTVHGIQGETTDAAIVGPGVDAAGLYVGMTRGRTHNEVIAIARTDHAAREAVADSMLRGIPEVSIDDSIRAARTELGRAARDTGKGRSRGVKPSEARPSESLYHQEWDQLRAQVAEIHVWLTDAKRRLLALDVNIEAARAASHGRGEPEAPDRWTSKRNELLAEHRRRMNHYDVLARSLHQVDAVMTSLAAVASSGLRPGAGWTRTAPQVWSGGGERAGCADQGAVVSDPRPSDQALHRVL